MSRRSPSRPLLLSPHRAAPLGSPTISRRRLLLGLGASTLRAIITGRFAGAPRTWDQDRADALVRALDEGRT